MNEDRAIALLVELHRDTPRQGPGSTASTLRALSLLPRFDASKTILDLGCGSGAQTDSLFDATEARIVAVDLFETFLEQAKMRFADRPDGDRVRFEIGDMFQLDYANDSFDMIWSEGALYIAGIEKAVKILAPLLKQDGYFCFTELSWLDATPPEECRKFWEAEYPAMRTVEGNCDILRAGSFVILDTFPLENEAWTHEYYGPLRERIPAMRAEYSDDEDALSFLDTAAKEIRMFERFHEFYNYVFYLARRTT